MSKSTPGPWILREQSYGYDVTVRGHGGGYGGWFIELHHGAGTGKNYSQTIHDAFEADARLIEAAPDMLEALKTLVDADNEANPLRTADMHRSDCQCLRCAFDNARSVIKKAEGR